MYDQIRGDILFIIFYAGVTFMAMTASCYLLLRRGNAFAAAQRHQYQPAELEAR